MHQPDYRPVPFQAWSGPPVPKSIATNTASRQKKAGQLNNDFIRRITCPARLAFYRDQENQMLTKPSFNSSSQHLDNDNARCKQRINRSSDSVNRRSQRISRSKCRINQISPPANRNTDVSDMSALRSRMKKKVRPVSDIQGSQCHRKKPSVTFSDVRQMIGTREQYFPVTNSIHATRAAERRGNPARTEYTQNSQYEHSDNSARSCEKKVASAGMSQKNSHTTQRGDEKKASSAQPPHCSRNCQYNVYHHTSKTGPKKKVREEPEKKKPVQQRPLSKAQPISVGGQPRVKDAKKNSALYYTNENMNKHIRHDLPGAVKRNMLMCNHNRTEKLPTKHLNRKKKGTADGTILFVKRGELKWPLYSGSLTMSEIMHVDIKPHGTSSTSPRDVSKTRNCRNASFDRRLSTHFDKGIATRNVKHSPTHRSPSRRDRKSLSSTSNRTFHRMGRSKGSLLNSPPCQSALFYSQKPERPSVASCNGLGHGEDQQQTGTGYSIRRRVTSVSDVIPNNFLMSESAVFPTNMRQCPPSCRRSRCVLHGDRANTTSDRSFHYEHSFSRSHRPTKCPIPFTRYPSASSQTSRRGGFIFPRKDSQGSFGRGMSKCSFFTCSELHLPQNDSLLLCASEPMKLTPHLNMKCPLSKVPKRPMSYTTNVTFMDLNMRNEPSNSVFGTAIAETETEPPPADIRLL